MNNLTINKEHMDFIRNLVMYAEDNKQFIITIFNFLYHQGQKLEKWEDEKKYRDNLHNAIEYFNEIIKNY